MTIQDHRGQAPDSEDRARRAATRCWPDRLQWRSSAIHWSCSQVWDIGSSGQEYRSRCFKDHHQQSAPGCDRSCNQSELISRLAIFTLSRRPMADMDSQDLMQSTVGPVKSVQMSFNATGKSTGQATVLFRNKGDANKAHTACKQFTFSRSSL